MPKLQPDETVIQLVLPREAKKALEKMVEVEDMPSLSELIRRLLEGYCHENGLPVDFSVGQWGGGSTRKNGTTSLKSERVNDNDIPVGAKVTHDKVIVTLADGRDIATPLAWYPWLGDATSQQRANVEIGPLMLYWPDLEEGISIESMLMGANDAVKKQLRRAG